MKNVDSPAVAEQDAVKADPDTLTIEGEQGCRLVATALVILQACQAIGVHLPPRRCRARGRARGLRRGVPRSMLTGFARVSVVLV